RTVNAGWQWREPAVSEVNHGLVIVGCAISIILRILDLDPVNLTADVVSIVNDGSEERPRKLALLVRPRGISQFREIDPHGADHRDQERLARGNIQYVSRTPAERKGQEPHMPGLTNASQRPGRV